MPKRLRSGDTEEARNEFVAQKKKKFSINASNENSDTEDSTSSSMSNTFSSENSESFDWKSEEDEEAQINSSSISDAESEDEKNITVDFGVFDMEPRHVTAVMHLIDQFCPDKRNEVDRDDYANALIESPYTSIIKLYENTDEEERDEEEEVCGFCSVLHFYNCQGRHSLAFNALYKLLKENVWRTAENGIPPIDLLVTPKSGASSESNMKALLWLFEMVPTVPIELSAQVIIDTLQRLEKDAADWEALQKTATKSGKNEQPVATIANEAAASSPCLFTMLARVQRTNTASPTSPVASRDSNYEKIDNQKKNQSDSAEHFQISDYTFVREEDEVFFNFRDKRVAVLAYRCRPLYEGCTEDEIPIALMFALQNQGMHQAAREIEKRASAPLEVTRFP